MTEKFKTGDIAYLTETTGVREVRIKRFSGATLVLVQYTTSSGGGTMVHLSRLYHSESDALDAIKSHRNPKNNGQLY